MRAFVLGLLVAALAWWWFDGGSGAGASQAQDGVPAAPAAGPSPVDAAANVGAGGPPALDAMNLPPARVASHASTEAPSRATDAAQLPAEDLEALLARLQQRDAASISLAFAWLSTSLGGTSRERLAGALRPTDDQRPLAEQWPQLLAALGANNAFLHSEEGRALATKAAQAAFALPDAEAVTAGTQLLTLMLRGRITKADSQARAFVDEVYKLHRVRVDRWLCDPGNIAGSRSYTVARGDSLARIAQRFRKEGLQVEDGTLAVLNRIHNPNSLQVGQKIKVPASPTVGVLEKRSFGFAIYVGEHLLRLYWVGHGAEDHTPLVEFTVGEKQPQPAWTAPDGQVYAYGNPKNILGEYFIKFLHDTYTGFGAHGTTLPETICTMSSAGCIRMLDADIAELFKILPRGAKVVVRASESIR